MPSVLKCLVLGSLVSICVYSKPPTRFHLGRGEQEVGYSQAVRSGNHVYISGTVGGTEGSTEEQLKQAYATIQKTMDQYKASFANVVMERIYTTDIDSLIKCQEYRKTLYGENLPAATWVEVKRLYSPSHKIEIEVELEL
jgi:2-iminobutanoate/2-iminopropanoate deaminase